MFKMHTGDFVGGPVVKTLPSNAMQGAQVQSLIGELRSYMLQSVARNYTHTHTHTHTHKERPNCALPYGNITKSNRG